MLEGFDLSFERTCHHLELIRIIDFSSPQTNDTSPARRHDIPLSGHRSTADFALMQGMPNWYVFLKTVHSCFYIEAKKLWPNNAPPILKHNALPIRRVYLTAGHQDEGDAGEGFSLDANGQWSEQVR